MHAPLKFFETKISSQNSGMARASQTATQLSQGPGSKRQRIQRPMRRTNVVRFEGKGLPNQLQATQKYAEFLTLNISGGGKASYLFSCNGMYDPNTTGTGHQPRYFDQYSALYDHYRVTGSKIKVTLYDHTLSSTGPTSRGLSMCVFIDDDATPGLSNQYDEFEREGNVSTTTLANKSSARVLRKAWNAKRAFGVKANGDACEGTSGAQPVEQQFFVISVQAEPTDIVTLLVELEYNATWTEQKSVGGS